MFEKTKTSSSTKHLQIYWIEVHSQGTQGNRKTPDLFFKKFQLSNFKEKNWLKQIHRISRRIN